MSRHSRTVSVLDTVKVAYEPGKMSRVSAPRKVRQHFYRCDICSEETSRRPPVKCTICNRDTCWHCGDTFPRDQWHNDDHVDPIAGSTSGWYCHDCWRFREDAERQVQMARDHFDREISKIRDQMLAKSSTEAPE